MSDFTIEIPTLETERLRLRAHTLDDFPAFVTMWAHPDVTRWIDGQPRPSEDTWLKFLRAAGFWFHLGFGPWVIEEKASGDVVGEVGFGDFKRNIDPPMEGTPEMSWVLAAPFHAKGMAQEAARVALEWGDAHLPGGQIGCIIDPLNAPSIAMAEKLAFVQAGRALYKGGEVNVYYRPISK